MTPTSTQASDTTLTLRDYWAMTAQHKDPFTQTHDALLGAPEGVPVAAAVQVANAFQPGLIWLLKSMIGLVAAWNVFAMLGPFATAVSFFVVLRRFDSARSGALIASYAIAFSPWILVEDEYGHIGLVHLWPIALVLLSLARLNERLTIRIAAELGLLWAVSFYVDSYVGAMTSVVVLSGLALMLVRQRGAANRLWICTLTCGVIGTTLVALSPIAIYLAVEGLRGGAGVTDRTVADFYGMPLQDFLIPSGHNPFLRWIPLRRGSDSQQTYVTLTLLGLATFALGRRRVVGARMRMVGMIAVVSALLGAALALPPYFRVLGHRLPTTSDGLALVTTYFRVNSEFGFLTVIGVACLAAFGLSAIRGRWRPQIVAICCVLCICESAVGYPLPSWSPSAPPDVRWLAAHPGGIVAIYPMFEFSPAFSLMDNLEYSFQPSQGHPIFNMLPENRPDWLGTKEFAIRALAKFPGSPAVAGILATEHVRYVVLHDDIYRAIGDALPVMPADSYRLVASLPNTRIYRVVASPTAITPILATSQLSVASVWGAAPATVTYGAGISRTPAGPTATYALSGTGSLQVKSGGWPENYQLQINMAAAGQTRTVSVLDTAGTVLAAAPLTGSESLVSLGPFPLPNGTSTLQLRVAPGGRTAGATLFGEPVLDELATYDRSVNG